VEGFFHRRAEGGGAFHLVVGEGAVGQQRVFLVQLGAATIVLEDEVDLGLAGVVGLHHLFAGLLAAVDEDDVARGFGRDRRAAEGQAQGDGDAKGGVIHRRWPRGWVGGELHDNAPMDTLRLLPAARGPFVMARAH
jgi:hypothetical protein